MQVANMNESLILKLITEYQDTESDLERDLILHRIQRIQFNQLKHDSFHEEEVLDGTN